MQKWKVNEKVARQKFKKKRGKRKKLERTEEHVGPFGLC